MNEATAPTITLDADGKRTFTLRDYEKINVVERDTHVADTVTLGQQILRTAAERRMEPNALPPVEKNIFAHLLASLDTTDATKLGMRVLMNTCTSQLGWHLDLIVARRKRGIIEDRIPTLDERNAEDELRRGEDDVENVRQNHAGEPDDHYSHGHAVQVSNWRLAENYDSLRRAVFAYTAEILVPELGNVDDELLFNPGGNLDQQALPGLMSLKAHKAFTVERKRVPNESRVQEAAARAKAFGVSEAIIRQDMTEDARRFANAEEARILEVLTEAAGLDTKPSADAFDALPKDRQITLVANMLNNVQRKLDPNDRRSLVRRIPTQRDNAARQDLMNQLVDHQMLEFALQRWLKVYDPVDHAEQQAIAHRQARIASMRAAEGLGALTEDLPK